MHRHITTHRETSLRLRHSVSLDSELSPTLLHPLSESPQIMESYYFAKASGRSASFSMQVQRLHAQSHADPVYDIRQKQVSRKKIKKVVYLNNPTVAIPHPSTASDSDYLLYDGTAPPLSSDRDELVYSAYCYDEPTILSVQFSSHGVLFSASSTPYLRSPGPRRARIDSSPPTISPVGSVSSSIKSASRRDSLVGTLNDDLAEAFFAQPVCWLLVLSRTNYKVIDQVTGTLLGKWMRPTAPSGSWTFVFRGTTVATLEGSRVRLSSTGEGETFMDEFSHNLRRRYLSKNTMANGAFSPSVRQQFLSGAGLTSGEHDTGQRRFKKVNIYRARLLDGVMFTSLALKMAEQGRSTRSASLDEVNVKLMPRSDTLASVDKRRWMSGFFHSIKAAWS